MKFKIGETVRLKQVTKDDKQRTNLTYWKEFKEYEGLTATIQSSSEHSKENTYFILIHSHPRQMKFHYAEAWLEKQSHMTHFREEN